ncbi:MAG TPA: DUF4097 family beta strand repeat-containing protein [Vicinamibacterales bacterium]
MKLKPAAVVFAFLALAASARADETEHFSRSLKLPAGGTVRLRGFSGRVSITATDGNEVSVDAVRRGSREWLNETKLEMYDDGSTIVIRDDRSTHSSWWLWPHSTSIGSTDFDIKVPRRTNLDVNIFSAPVTVDGVEGNHRIHGFSSRIRLRNAAGSVQAHTFSGAVEIEEARWIDSETIDIDTFSGNVALRVPGDARGAVSFHSFSGRLDSEIPLTMHSSSRRAVEAELGGGGAGRLRVKTFSGSLRIDR